MTDEDDLDKIREEKMRKLREQAQADDQEAREEQQRAAEQQREALLKQYTTADARKRLNTVKMAKPELANQVEQQLIALIQQGRIRDGQEINEDQMREILKEAQPDDDGFNIRRR